MINIYAYWQVTLVWRLSGINRFNLCNQVFRPWRFWYRWLPGTRNSDERSLLRGASMSGSTKLSRRHFAMWSCGARCTSAGPKPFPVPMHRNLGLIASQCDLSQFRPSFEFDIWIHLACYLFLLTWEIQPVISPCASAPAGTRHQALAKTFLKERELAAMTTEEEAWSHALFLGISEWGCGCVPRWMLNACRGKISNPFSCWVWWIPVSSRVSANCKQDVFSCILHCLENEHVKDLEIVETAIACIEFQSPKNALFRIQVIISLLPKPSLLRLAWYAVIVTLVGVWSK